MSLMDNGSNGMVMPVSPMYGGGGNGGFCGYVVQNPNCCAPQTFGCGCAVA